MKPTSPGLNDTDKDILEVMYLYGRGYGTTEILSNCLDYSIRTIKKRLKILREADWVKAFKVNQYFVYLLTKQTIELFGREKYLERMKSRNETIALIYDKLKMLSFFGEYRNKNLKFIYPFDKFHIFNRHYNFRVKELKTFYVGKSTELFFNDVMFTPEQNLLQELIIVLFPRAEVHPSTYLRDFLIKQYYYLNAKLLESGVDVQFLIATTNEMLEDQYKQVIKNCCISRIFKKQELIEGSEGYYNIPNENNYRNTKEIQYLLNSNEHPVYLDRFKVDTTNISIPHSYFT